MNLYCTLCQVYTNSRIQHAHESIHRTNLKEKPMPRHVVMKILKCNQKPSLTLLNKFMIIQN